MILLIISYLFIMALIRLIAYFLYLVNLSDYIFVVLISIFIIFFLFIRLLFFFTPYEITVKDILFKYRNFKKKKKHSKAYLILLKFCYVLVGKSILYYDQYFSLMYLKWQICRGYFQKFSFFSIVKFVVKSYLKKKDKEFKYFLYLVKKFAKIKWKWVKETGYFSSFLAILDFKRPKKYSMRLGHFMYIESIKKKKNYIK